MLTASRALGLNATSAPELPRVDGLRDLYPLGGNGSGVRPRQGEMIMIAGRSGTQKSGFALWWVSAMNLPTLYMSGDMSAFQASARLASTVLGETTEEVVEGFKRDRDRYLQALEFLQIRFSFGKPITLRALEQEFDAEVELHNRYPSIVVIDNLMDMAGANSDYTAQMDLMQALSDMSRDTGATVLVLHHASDKTWDAQSAPWKPPSRDQIKNGLAEKPELVLTVALDPTTQQFRIAPVKQRMGFSDPSGNTYATLQADPERTRFYPYH